MRARAFRIRGVVQGVGFRPMVWQVAQQLKVTGYVLNDNEGVLTQVWGTERELAAFIGSIQSNLPPLARIDSIDEIPLEIEQPKPDGFKIVNSRPGIMGTHVVTDAATCPQCINDILDPGNRRYRYPFTNCTHCGPRVSIIKAMPYDRENTSMADFSMCSACQEEYNNPGDRRFHAQPNACPDCGPMVWLEDSTGRSVTPGTDQKPAETDPVEAAASLIRQGYIVAIKGIGGFHLACDAANHEAVVKLRQRKHRYHKPLALMARDVAMLGEYVHLNQPEQSMLTSRAAPIVLLDIKQAGAIELLSDSLAPGQKVLGFMLPYTPLHYLLMQNMTHPVVMTSANISDDPQLIDNNAAREKLANIADYFLFNNRDIINRLDDSVVRLMDKKARLLRLARGYAPYSIKLPDGFPGDVKILAMGGELKNTFCLLKNGTLVVSQYIGDLENALALRDYQHHLGLYGRLYDFSADAIVVDKHPDYLSTQLGRNMAVASNTPLVAVQHHHAHIASCLLEHGYNYHCENVLGIALDGLGYGEDGTIWGGEFFLASYRQCQRLAGFQPVRMPGGTQAIKEPWRNTLAHLLATELWETLAEQYPELDIIRFLHSRPVSNLKTMIKKGLNSPYASSAGRLFDAVAAAVGICTQGISYEGQAAIELEAAACKSFKTESARAYPFSWSGQLINWAPMWQALFKDLVDKVSKEQIAARFHHCVIQAVVQVARELAQQHKLQTIVLSGGVFQNKLLLEGVSSGLRKHKLKVIAPQLLPMNDAGISAGQVAVALSNL